MDLYYYKEIIDKNIDLISKSDKVISFGYEWALSLENKKKMLIIVFLTIHQKKFSMKDSNMIIIV